MGRAPVTGARPLEAPLRVGARVRVRRGDGAVVAAAVTRCKAAPGDGDPAWDVWALVPDPRPGAADSSCRVGGPGTEPGPYDVELVE